MAEECSKGEIFQRSAGVVKIVSGMKVFVCKQSEEDPNTYFIITTYEKDGKQ